MLNLMIYIVALGSIIGLPLVQMSEGANPIVTNILHAAFAIAFILRVFQYVGTYALQVVANRGDAGPYLKLMNEVVYRRAKLSAAFISYVILAGCGYIWTTILFTILHVVIILMHYSILESVKTGKLNGIDDMKEAKKSGAEALDSLMAKIDSMDID